jgi:hypothetical protein
MRKGHAPSSEIVRSNFPIKTFQGSAINGESMAGQRPCCGIIAASLRAEQAQNKRQCIGGFEWDLHGHTRCSDEVMVAR